MEVLLAVLLAAALAAVALFLLRGRFRALIYDRLITDMTSQWYKAVLERVEPKAHILDVGIGTGAALARNAARVLTDGIRVTGVDYDEHYVKKARAIIIEHGLEAAVDVYHESIYDFEVPSNAVPFDAAYFSGSLMLMPDPVAALVHVGGLLSPQKQADGKSARVFYFTQTFQERPDRLLEFIKPLLKYIVTIDFGRVTYESDFMATTAEAGLEIVENTIIGNAGNGKRTYRVIKALLR